MSQSSPRHACAAAAASRLLAVTLVGGGLVAVGSTASGTAAPGASVTSAVAPAVRSVTFHGYTVAVPKTWRVVDLAADPHACVRFDRPALYLGHPGDQRACPSHLIGGAPGLLVEPLDDRSFPQVDASTLRADRSGAVSQLPAGRASTVVVVSAGVLVTASYGSADSPLVQQILAAARTTPGARSTPSSSLDPVVTSERRRKVNAPGRYLGGGFDTCAAPSQTVMNAWRSASPYRAVGVYFGGNSRGCAQPNLTPYWVAEQAQRGWHLIPTYVGLQAPCTRFYHRMSYDAATAQAQGFAEGRDAVADAKSLGIGAPSVLYSDIEGYDTTIASCVSSVRSYVTGWTKALHRHGYQSGVYSSAASGIQNLSQSYRSTVYTRPDDIWIAWWNGVADTDGGSYVPSDQWSNHQRIHQYLGATTKTFGGYSQNIDVNYLDVGASGPSSSGCPTDVTFSAYPKLKRGAVGPTVRAAQCLLSRRGFTPGVADGKFRVSTQAALSAFKVSRGMSGKAVLGRRTWTALLSGGTTPRLTIGSQGRPVRRVQRSLTAALQRPVASRGEFTRATERAVAEYQRTRLIKDTGIVRAATWVALQSGAEAKR